VFVVVMGEMTLGSLFENPRLITIRLPRALST
jgi:hypothetical protein